MGWINSFAGPHVQNSTSTLEMFIYRVCKSHKLEANMAPEALMETKTGHRWYLLIQITPVPMHLRHWSCCCRSTNAVIFSDLRAAARIGICFNTMLKGQCCPLLTTRLFFPPHQWFKKASQWSKKGQKFCMGSTASVNNMGDPSLQGAGAHTLVHHPAVSPDSNKKLMCQNSHPPHLNIQHMQAWK